ncbi:hypothetical protein [Ramlibacter sp.]|uniref:hypothetical protein n=1 Tax=Ramlibacter sp. TaxID=1917967 RepID=UPI0035B3F7CE
MIRFIPDTWRDALLRPIAMAAPDGGVYVETIAPDFRFVFILALAAAWVLLRVGRALPQRRQTLALLAFIALTFAPWLLTSGNGRYFLAALFLAGPLCIGLLHHLPIPGRIKITLASLMIGLQVFLIHENEPWRSWGLVPWTAPPAFDVDIPEDLRTRPGTYLTVSGISYSLIAPRFHPDSRWISLASQPGGPPDNVLGHMTRDFLAASPRIELLFPSLPGQGVKELVPPAELVDALDLNLGGHGLAVATGQPCRFLRSTGLTAMGSRLGAQEAREVPEQRGFWLCPLQRVAAKDRASQPKPDPRVEAVFNRLEQTCPRLFPPGQATTNLLTMGARRFYVTSDMRVYVLNDGRVLYKYLRALNAVDVGTSEQVLAPDFRMDCHNIRGRTGLPWERGI